MGAWCWRLGWVSAVVGLGCVGPPAPDAELCRDVITRLCVGPLCTSTQSALMVEEGTCEATLLARTGCDSDEFGFSTPSRARVLECRVPLLRVGTSRYVKAACEDVDEMVGYCPDLVRFLKGEAP